MLFRNGLVTGCLALVLLSASSVDADPKPGSNPTREVSFPTSDGGKIFAALTGDGEHAVVLCHGARFDKESWSAQVETLSGKGFQVLAIDFRGYGKSKGGSGGRALHLDVLAAVDYLHKHGAKRVSVVGASMGGGAAAQAVTEAKPGAITGLVLLAAVPIRHPEKIRGKKLFVVAEGDRLRRSVERQYEAAVEPKKLVVLNGNAHAQHLFKTAQADDLINLISEWLAKSVE